VTVEIHSTRVGTLPRVVERVRSKPWLSVAITAGALLVLAWIAWAIYVGIDRGGRQALGVLIAWPVIIAAAALVCLPILGIYLLIRRQADADSPAAPAEAPGEPET
jgi:uncharacterized protein with PQ loop repeat